MATPGIPQNFFVQTGNGTNLVSWNLTAGALTYVVQRSLDQVTYATIATVSSTQYLDTAVTLGTSYSYQVAAKGANSGLASAVGANTVTVPIAAGFSFSGSFKDGVASYTYTSNIAGVLTGVSPNPSGIIINGDTLVQATQSPFTTPQAVVPTTTGEMSLGAIRLAAQQRADRVDSQFVTLPEWNFFINQAMFELYDLLITVYEDYYIAPPASFSSDGSTFLYPLPDGLRTFNNQAGQPFVPAPFYKLSGVDLALNNANNAYVTVNKFNFIDRNRFVYPNTASTIYGVFNLQYRLVGLNQIELIPTPSAGQVIRLWYIPRMQQLLLDTDVTVQGISGYLQYVIVRAAKYALDKEESPTDALDQELLFLKKRIEESASNRDAGQADTISDVRQGGWRDGWSGGRNGMVGGF